MSRRDRVDGILLGTALGDAAGLPFEGLSPRRIARRLARHSLMSRRGRRLLSDDTEHTALIARAVATSGGEPAAFDRALSRLLRRWLWTLPPGIGWATLRSLLKLSVGWPSSRSGVSSAGNGPAMRAALLGVCALVALADALRGAPLPRDRTLLALPRNLVAGALFVCHAVRRLAW